MNRLYNAVGSRVKLSWNEVQAAVPLIAQQP